MSNSYFDWPAKIAAQRFVAFDTVRSQDANNAFDEVAAGFAKLPSPSVLWADNQNYAVAGGVTDAWTATVATAYLTAYTDGMRVRVKFPADNTAVAPTLNVNALGAKVIVNEAGGPLAAGNINADSIVELVYNGTLGKFQINLGNFTSDSSVNAAAAAASAAAASTSQGAAAGSAAAAATSATNAATSATNAATSATAASGSATSASNSANDAASAAATIDSYPNAAATSLPRCLTQASVGAITPGAGGTNGTFALGFSAGTGWIDYPSGTFTVAGGAVTAVTITGPGLNIHAAPTVPTVSFAASAGLAGAAVALTLQLLVAAGQRYLVASVDGLTLDFYKNAAGVATRDTTLPSISSKSSVGRLTSMVVPGADHAVQDDSDNAAQLLESGIFKFAKLETEYFNGYPRSELSRALRRSAPRLRANYVHVISYGQSLSVGSNAAIHTLSAVGDGFFDAVRFNANGSATAGPRAQDGTGTVAQNHASFVPYLEQVNGSGFGETPLGNCIRMMRTLLRDEDGIPVGGAYDMKFIGSAPGQANLAIASLAKGSAPYQRVLDDVTYGKALANADGKSYVVGPILWCQGERDIQLNTSYATYLAAFQQLYTDLNTDIKAIVGPMQDDIVMVCYQVAMWDQGTYGSSFPNIALAQLDAAKANPKIVIATSTYAVEHIASNDVHLTGFGSASLGARMGLAAKRVFFDGETWPMAYPRKVARQGNILELELPDTGYPWALSTSLYPTQAASGFTCTRADGVTGNAVTAVAVDWNRVRLTLTFSEGGILYYGLNAGGNLHDTNTTDPLTARNGVMYHPFLMVKEVYA